MGMASGVVAAGASGFAFTMRDGIEAEIRELREEDREELERFVDGLSEDTIYFRFLASGINREVLI